MSERRPAMVTPPSSSRKGPATRSGHRYEILTPPLPGQRAELSCHALAAGAVTGGPGDPPIHEPGSREQHIQQLLDMIPPDASVSASSNINPHVSERQHLAVFPLIKDNGNDTPDTVQYIIVDLNAVFPEDRGSTTNELNHLLRSGQYIEIARAEGVVLLVRRIT